MRLEPRPYQKDAISSVMQYLFTKPGNPVLDACVGSGKSLMIAEVVGEILKKDPNARILMLTHVKELIEQNFEKLVSQLPGVNAGIYSASIGKRQAHKQVVYAGIQSIHKRYNQIGHVNVIMIDEVHLVSPNDQTMYRKFISMMQAINPRIRIVGFTGTAYRTKEGLITEGENALFDDVCHQVSMADLIKMGYLMPLVSKQSEVQADLSGVKIRGGEFLAKDMQDAMDKDELTEAALNDVERWASDRRCGLFFCSGVDHAEHVRDSLRGRGYTAEMVTGKTPKKERERILGEFKAGQIKYLTNDSVLTTGTDIPMLDLIVLLRGTQSPVLYTQILGRGVRCFGKDAQESISRGKKNCMVLDFGGNIERHGPVDKIRFKPKKQRDGGGILVQPVKICEKCREPNPVFAKVCENCQHEFPRVERSVNHEKVAYDGAILSSDIRPETKRVSRVIYSRHKKRGGQDSMKVTYYSGLKEVACEWVCIEHQGYAHNKARSWWKKMHGDDMPATIAEALQKQPTIPYAVWVKKNGKYMEIIGYEFDKPASSADKKHA